ncbi:MAG: hypothetical protein PHE09_16545, partial [Oscillospiraceae bacterium]|nr:hypothetical protein [Oscillospiraceae bacterium]
NAEKMPVVTKSFTVNFFVYIRFFSHFENPPFYFPQFLLLTILRSGVTIKLDAANLLIKIALN